MDNIPLGRQYDDKYINEGFIRQVKELVDQKGSGWCLNSSDQRLGWVSKLGTPIICGMAALLLLLKTSNAFCTFMLNEKTIFHAWWNKIACPVARSIGSIPRRLKTLCSRMSQKIALHKQAKGSITAVSS